MLATFHGVSYSSLVFIIAAAVLPAAALDSVASSSSEPQQSDSALASLFSFSCQLDRDAAESQRSRDLRLLACRVKTRLKSFLKPGPLEDLTAKIKDLNDSDIEELVKTYPTMKGEQNASTKATNEYAEALADLVNAYRGWKFGADKIDAKVHQAQKDADDAEAKALKEAQEKEKKAKEDMGSGNKDKKTHEEAIEKLKNAEKKGEEDAQKEKDKDKAKEKEKDEDKDKDKTPTAPASSSLLQAGEDHTDGGTQQEDEHGVGLENIEIVPGSTGSFFLHRKRRNSHMLWAAN